MSKTQRLIIFCALAVALGAIFATLVITTALQVDIQVVLFSTLLMLCFTSLFLEHYFVRPTDVLAASLSVLLLIAPLHAQLQRFGIWYWIFFFYCVATASMAFAALMLVDSTRSPNDWQMRLSLVLKNAATWLGSGRILFFTLFFFTLLFYVDSQSSAFLLLAAYSAIVLLLDPGQSLPKFLSLRRVGPRRLGELIGVQSGNMFLARLDPSEGSLRQFDIVQFNCTRGHEPRNLRGIVVDSYLLDAQQWIRILVTKELNDGKDTNESVPNAAPTDVYRCSDSASQDIRSRFVGVVVKDSRIDAVRFEYAGEVPVSEGTLLEAQVENARVLYQIVQGKTAIEQLEQKNETGMVVGEALQLGVWNGDRQVFEKYGWVPDINTALFVASSPSSVTIAEKDDQIGIIPGTTYPVVVDLSQAVSHHLAVLGVTGSGKSFFVRHLIRRLSERGHKVICVDFTNEYNGRLRDLSPAQLVEGDTAARIFRAIDYLAVELEKFKNQQNVERINEARTVVQNCFREAIEAFLSSDASVCIFELPDVSNNTAILEYTKECFRQLFAVVRARTDRRQQLCVVLEEAHTVVPEWNFIGADDRRAQSVVNSISQIALQGRKYGVGFIVVAQRTANVSKTVLTQCNSVVAFQQFDRTSSEFLGNYMSEHMIRALGGLRPRQAICAGKGFRGGVPLIFEVPELVEAMQTEHGGG